jgi:hypothetical protein
MEEQHKMAIRIQLRRDTAANWTSANPTLRAGEVGIETDTLKFKIGNGTQTWTQITTYANVTPSSLTSSLSDYILAADQGTAGGPAELDSNGDLIVPENSIILWNDADYDYITTLTATQPTANRTITIPNATGTMALTSDLSPYAPLSGATFTGNINVPTAITFEGATADSYETTIQVTDPTADRTITIPDVGGTFVTSGDTGSVTNTMLAGSIANDKLSNSAITINGTSTSLGGTRTLGTDDITEGTTNKYFTDERAQDAIATAIAAGTHTNITITYDDSTNKFTFVGANTYSDENAQDAIGNAVGTGLSYNDTTGAISVDTATIQARVTDVSDTEIGYLNGVTSAIQTQIDSKFATANASTTNISEGTNQYFTVERAQDAVGEAVGTGLSYNDTTGAISVDTTAIQAKVANVDDTEIGYLNGVTSGIQTQINNKASLSGATFTGAVSGTSLTLSGDLTVNGTTTTLNSTTISVDDKNIELGSVATPSDATADGGGITLKGTTDKTFNWVDATDAWTSSEHINLASGKSLYLNSTLLKDATETLTNKTLTSPVINTPTGITKSDVGLANVDNTTDANKPVSTATQTALDLKLASATAATTYAPLASPTFTGTVTLPSGTVTSTMIADGTIADADINASAAIALSKLATDPLARANHTGSQAASTISDFNEAAQDAVGTILSGDLVYNDSTPGIAVNYVTVGNTLLDGVSGSSYGLIGTSTYLDVKNTNGYNKEIELDIAAVKTQLNTDGYLTTSSTSTLTNKTLTSPKINEDVAVTATATELNYVDGVTSAIQTQLDGKVDESLFDTKGDILVASADNTPAKLAAGTNGYLLTANSAATNGVEWAAAPVSLPSQTGNSGKYLTTDGTDATWGTLVVPITTGTATVSANTATTVDTTALSAFTSIEYMVSLKQGSKVRTSKVVVQTDGTSVDMTEFAITETGGTIAGVVVSAVVSSTNAVLQLTATDATSTNVTVKFSKVKL